MQSSKIDFVNKYNRLIQSASSYTDEFPSILCDFITEEFELDAAALFKVTPSSTLEVIGKSTLVKKSIKKSAILECENCKLIKSDNLVSLFNIQNDCTISLTDVVQNEVCCTFNITHSERILIKAAKKSKFTQVDLDNLEDVKDFAKHLLRVWNGNRQPTGLPLSGIVASIAQELRTPTNSIMGFASLLNEENLSPSQSEYVTTLKDNAFELLSIINDLIDLAKFENGINKTVKTKVELADFINEVMTLFTDKLDSNKIEFITEIDKTLPSHVNVDSQKLRYVLVNIISNSVKITEKGKIILSVYLSGKNRLTFRITDSSSGLPMRKVSEIFQPFALNELYNIKIGNTTGLGLTLAKKYIESQVGDVSVASTIGKGTTYTFTITAEIDKGIEVQLSSIPKPTDKRNKVLVVEDDYATSKLLGNYLTKWGYEPFIVNSAQQALNSVEKEQYLAVLMDIVLPDANGFELLKQIREHQNTKNTPVIVCSVETEQQKAFLMGAVEYFVKPINYKYLVEVLTSYKLKKDSNILIVDDDVPTLNLLKEAVEQCGFNAIAESHSSKVISMIENMTLDLAIIDLDMPEINGFDLIKLIKSNKNFAKLPIMIYTGKENYQDDLKKIDGLFEELLNKSSTNIEDLADTINAMINRYDEPSTPEEIKDKVDDIKILLVEDYKHSQIIVTRLLKKNNYDSIVVVENGAEAVDAVQRQRYDIILMDMQMPVMNGFEATQKIREITEYKDTPIIALTAFAMKGDREKCLEAGATDYIPKPIDSQEFIQKVKHYTESKVSSR
ncbi:MAG TPA: response regulator [Ignavibacteriaceae bacterium]|nr:response regulator [Ignavibacteriaceae bacterium]